MKKVASICLIFIVLFCSACDNNANDIATSEVSVVANNKQPLEKLREYTKYDSTNKLFYLEDFKPIEISKSTIFDVYEITGGYNERYNPATNFPYDIFPIDKGYKIKFSYHPVDFRICEITISDKNGNIIDKIK